MKIIALYLPQYHEIPENDVWWGKGYTEWSAVRAAKPLFKNHYEPHVPLNNNYYDLSDESGSVWKWQVKLANDYGIYGFCIYHYWFGEGKQLLQKPAEILLKHPEIPTHFCICWANESWTKTWYGLSSTVLMEQKYGDMEERRKHFLYLLAFFKDPRYIKVGNKPMLLLYKTMNIPDIEKLMSEWNKYAVDEGFSGIYFVAGNTNLIDEKNKFEAYYDFEPTYSLKHGLSWTDASIYYGTSGAKHLYNRVFMKQCLERKIDATWVYKAILRRAKRNLVKEKKGGIVTYSGIFPCWDNTPRRGYLGATYTKTSVKIFFRYLSKLNSFTPKDKIVFVNAWNEWGEGCHLEPDERWRYGFLEAIESCSSKK